MVGSVCNRWASRERTDGPVGIGIGWKNQYSRDRHYGCDNTVAWGEVVVPLAV
jgi:hypothetical protein